jgi:hypothetical protein
MGVAGARSRIGGVEHVFAYVDDLQIEFKAISSASELKFFPESQLLFSVNQRGKDGVCSSSRSARGTQTSKMNTMRLIIHI